jgi:dihydroxy-acid dehydratase
MALIHDGDQIRLDLRTRRLDLLIDADELARRRQSWSPPPPRYQTGVLAKYARLVGSAAGGAVCE